MFRSSTSSFDRLLEKATSQLLLEPDWQSTMAINDLIRGGEVPPRYAVSAVKKRFYSDNPHVALYALQVMESCVKNCGSLVHEEVATKAFMEELRDLVKRSQDDAVKRKVLEMIQNWGMAFRNSQKYRIVTDTLNLMKAEGWEFPPVREAEAMFEADVAPEWAEGEVCHRCRAPFGIMTRQHHCRACGQVFCGKCSAKSCLLPKFGIEKEVRVCDSCYDEYGPKDSQPSSAQNSPAKTPSASAAKAKQQHKMAADSDLPAEYLNSSLAQQSQAPPPRSGKTEEEIKEEEELQLALALSQSEAEEQEKSKKKLANQYRMQQQQQTVQKKEEKPVKDEDITPELMRYLNRDYWEQKEKEKEAKKEQSSGASMRVKSATERYQAAGGANAAAAAAPGAMAAPPMDAPSAMGAGGFVLARGKDDEDLDEFVTTLKTQVEIFVNRMKSNSSRGRSIANDSSVQTLFMNTMAMHSQLLKHIQTQEDKRVHYEGLQDKITQVKDARAALEALREEERERKRREAEEAERLRQIQMQEKLEVMRKKKQEYLQYQRQLALQRMQEQEREMLMRQEQAKQQYHGMMPPNPQMAGMYAPAPGMPPGSMQPGMAPQYMPPAPGMQQPYGAQAVPPQAQQPVAAYATDPNVAAAGMNPPGAAVMGQPQPSYQPQPDASLGVAGTQQQVAQQQPQQQVAQQPGMLPAQTMPPSASAGAEAPPVSQAPQVVPGQEGQVPQHQMQSQPQQQQQQPQQLPPGQGAYDMQGMNSALPQVQQQQQHPQAAVYPGQPQQPQMHLYQHPHGAEGGDANELITFE